MEIPAPIVLTFTVSGQAFAFPLPIVEKVIRAVAVTPVPHLPDMISGFMDYHGTILPVYNLRKKLGMDDKSLSVTDQFILIRSATRRLAVIADAVTGIAEHPLEAGVPVHHFSTDMEVSGIIRLESGLLLILDPEKLLSADDEHQLQQTLNPQRNPKKG